MITTSMILWLLKVYIIYYIFLLSYILLCIYTIGVGQPLMIIISYNFLIIRLLRISLFDIGINGAITEAYTHKTIDISPCALLSRDWGGD